MSADGAEDSGEVLMRYYGALSSRSHEQRGAKLRSLSRWGRDPGGTSPEIPGRSWVTPAAARTTSRERARCFVIESAIATLWTTTSRKRSATGYLAHAIVYDSIRVR